MIIYVYVLSSCPVCHVIKNKIQEMHLNKYFIFIDEHSIIFPSNLNNFNNFNISFPSFFRIIDNRKILLNRSKLINKLLGSNNHHHQVRYNNPDQVSDSLGSNKKDI